MPATRTDLTVEQGADWSHGWLVSYNGDAIDDTWTAESQVRASATAAEVLHAFEADVNSDGSVVIGVSAETSALWTWEVARYDVIVTNSDDTVTLRVAQGRVTVDRGVTR